MRKKLFTIIIGASFFGLVVAYGFYSYALTCNPQDVAPALMMRTVKERADIKATEIARCGYTGTYSDNRTGVTVEVRDLIKIDGGIQLYARAWKGFSSADLTKQYGFGDGSVEWERFIIQNPPILVDDPAGTITRTWIDPDGTITKTENDPNGIVRTRRLREDHIAALQQTLAHTIKVSGKQNTQIVMGKEGHTVLTVFPDAGTGATTVDGVPAVESVQDTWAALIAEAGNVVYNTNASDFAFRMVSDSVSGKFQHLYRSIFTFDTSALGASATISAAVMSVVGESKLDEFSTTPDADVYTSTPASNNILVAGDFAQIGSTAQTDAAIAYADLNADSTYEDFTLNATGQGNISKTSITKFAIRNANRDVANSSPTWASLKVSRWTITMADAAGTSADPKLVVTYTAPVSTGGKSLKMFFIE